MSLSQLAPVVDGELRGDDVRFCGAAIDSRQLRLQQLFVAFRGEHVDGHEFLPQAREKGAAAALVEHYIDDPLPQLKVASTRHALGLLAGQWRQRFTGTLVGLTGSNGKTSVKEILSTLLGVRGKVLATSGNLNNDIGMPLTLTGLRQEHDFAVIEMGASHAGEIDYLSAIARPDIAIITNAGPAHLEGFGSIEGVARAKGEILNGLAPEGVCVLNADDRYFPLWQKLAGGRRIVTFGMRNQADVSGSKSDNAQGVLSVACLGQKLEAPFALPGDHNVMNALAACAAAAVAGLSVEQIADGLARVQPVPGRLEVKPGLNGAVLIDDTYNANPASLDAALNVLAGYQHARRLLVLGDMAELGVESERLHAEIGERAKAVGVEQLFALGRLSGAAARSFGAGGHAFVDRQTLLDALKGQLDASCVVLIKGSRSAHMEMVVNAISGVVS